MTGQNGPAVETIGGVASAWHARDGVEQAQIGIGERIVSLTFEEVDALMERLIELRTCMAVHRARRLWKL